MVWANIDKPTKRITLHPNNDLMNPNAKYKGMNEVKRDSSYSLLDKV
ncbi:hypothetical protein [Halalkalibacter alkaliphilus]|uniref:Uncharacterized protein n=1 Tax=Halalkalibacter alkaliphilus TaxID=2917993 RepID=A0A9X2CV14_9BACI|nr:hypothetical protein [Halalkalibacter alkaliphilus]MCL7748774.1 hypothetical protein [Halalkalibacter alkaliphilus]